MDAILRRLALLALLLILPVSAWATSSARTFAGGAATNNIKTASAVTWPTQASVAIWFNVTGLDANGRVFWNFENTAGGGNSTIFVNTTVIEFVAEAWSPTVGVWTIPAPTTGAWHHLLLTYDGSATTNNAVFYLDGVSQTVTRAQAPVGTYSPSAQIVTIGNGDGTLLDNCFNGSLAGFATWNGVLLAQADATNLAAGMPPCAIQQNALVLYLPMDAGQSPEQEYVSNNNGTVTGATVGTGPTATFGMRCPKRALMGVGR